MTSRSLAALAFCFAFAAAFEVQAVLLPNGSEGFVTATNNAGDQVGFFAPADGIPEVLGFEITHQGDFLLIGPSFHSESVPGWPRDNAVAIDINNSGDIVGWWKPFLSPEPVYQSFLYDDGVYIRIEICQYGVPSPPACSGDHGTLAEKIFDNGDVIGSFGINNITVPGSPVYRGDFLWRNGVFYTDDVPGFPTFPPGVGLPNPSTLVLVALGLLLVFLGTGIARSHTACCVLRPIGGVP